MSKLESHVEAVEAGGIPRGGGVGVPGVCGDEEVGDVIDEGETWWKLLVMGPREEWDSVSAGENGWLVASNGGQAGRPLSEHI